MKKKYVVMMLAMSMLVLPGCSKVNATSMECHCTCEGCEDCVNKQTQEEEESTEAIIVRDTENATQVVENQETQTQESEVFETEEASDMVQEPASDQENSVANLSEGERAARKEQQANFAKAREQIYQMENCLEKTQKINELDKQIVANNSFDFSDVRVQFLGDSITEGICGTEKSNGDNVSYVDYVAKNLQFEVCMNNGKAGRMFTDFGGAELSFSQDMGSMYNNSADVSVIFLGVNDYLTGRENKRFGNINEKESTAGYVGSIRYAMNQLKANYPNQYIFFVTMYDINKTAESTYTDVKGNPGLGEYMEQLRQLTEEYGYHLIELYDTGFMDCNDAVTRNKYTADGLHPVDSGNQILGEHIAAELSLYFSQK